jgi:hypothetical protein
MGVIGRLDDQVWKTIIEPIAKRHEREAQEAREREKREAAREEETRAQEEKSGDAK